ncbi:MAG TPA: hypothetical protein VFD58_33635 [Blastocatellia bacterium]|nr:hypothetical protein [Blastocatellia bacterium]
MKTDPPINEAQEYQHWGRVYVAVLITTAVVISALWLFSKAFQ